MSAGSPCSRHLLLAHKTRIQKTIFFFINYVVVMWHSLRGTLFSSYGHMWLMVWGRTFIRNILGKVVVKHNNKKKQQHRIIHMSVMVSQLNHHQLDRSFNSLFRQTTTKISKPFIAAFLWDEPPLTDRFPSQRASNMSETVSTYRQVSNIRRTKSRHFKDSRTVLRLSLPNPLKPDVKSRMKM